MRFYKFLSPSYLNIIALSNLQLIFGRFSRFNDIFEGHLTFEYRMNRINHLIKIKKQNMWIK